MAPHIVGIIWFVTTFVFIIFLRMPLGPALGLCGFFGLAQLLGLSNAASMVGYIAWDAVVNYLFSAVPLFLLMGTLATVGGLSSDAFWGIRKWVGRLPGGLAITTVGACGAFAAVSGHSLANAASMGTIAFGEMRKHGYDRKLAAGSICAGGTLGGMIPPSIPLLIIALLTEQPVGIILIAGFLPGILEILVYSTIIILLVKLKPGYGPPSEGSTWREKWAGLWKLWPVVTLFLSVMGGIYAGVFTPTEGAAIGAFVAAVLGFIKKTLTWRKILEALDSAAISTGSLLFVLLGSLIFNAFLAHSQLPMWFSHTIAAMQSPAWVIVLLIVLLYLFLGATMSTMAMILLTVPITYGIMVTDLGFNGIWYAIIIERLVEIAAITPPIGMICFAFQAALADQEKIPIGEVFKGIIPFLIGDIVCLIILLVFPGFVLLLPNLMAS